MAKVKKQKVDNVVITMIVISTLIIMVALCFIITYKNDNYKKVIKPVEKNGDTAIYNIEYKKNRAYKLNDNFYIEIEKINNNYSILVNGKNKIIDGEVDSFKFFIKGDYIIYITNKNEVALYIIDADNNIKKYDSRDSGIKDLNLIFVDLSGDVLTLYFDRYVDYKYIVVDGNKYNLCDESINNLDQSIITERIYEINYDNNKFGELKMKQESNLKTTLETRESCLE